MITSGQKACYLSTNSFSKFQIDIDFEFLHPGKQMIFFDKWEDFVPKFINCYPGIIKDKYIKCELGNKLATVGLDKGELPLQFFY
jgi:hypothetical protein